MSSRHHYLQTDIANLFCQKVDSTRPTRQEQALGPPGVNDHGLNAKHLSKINPIQAKLLNTIPGI